MDIPRRLWLYWCGQTVSGIGDAFRRLTLTLWVFETSGGSGVAVSGVILAELIPYFLVGSFAGAWVDRLQARAVLLVADAGRALIGAVMAVAALHGQLGVVYVGIVCATVLGVFADGAHHKVVPSLVPDPGLERANALLTVGQQVAFIVGPALAAWCYTALGAGAAFAVDGLTFAASFAFTAIALELRPLETSAIAQRSLLRDALEGWRYTVRSGLSFGLLVSGVLHSASAGINNTVMVFFVTRALGSQPQDLAWLGTANGIAQLVVGGAFIAWSQRVPLAVALVSGSLLMTCGNAIIASSSALTFLIAGVIVTSLGNAPVNIAVQTAYQRFTPQALLARVRGLADLASTGAFFVASSGAGLTVGSGDARGLLWMSAGLMALALLIVTVRVARALAHPDSTSSKR